MQDQFGTVHPKVKLHISLTQSDVTQYHNALSGSKYTKVNSGSSKGSPALFTRGGPQDGIAAYLCNTTCIQQITITLQIPPQNIKPWFVNFHCAAPSALSFMASMKIEIKMVFTWVWLALLVYGVSQNGSTNCLPLSQCTCPALAISKHMNKFADFPRHHFLLIFFLTSASEKFAFATLTSSPAIKTEFIWRRTTVVTGDSVRDGRVMHARND